MNSNRNKNETKFRGVNVLFLQSLPENVENYLERKIDPDVKLIFPHNFTEKDIMNVSPHVDIVVGWRPDMNLLKRAKKCKLFIIPGTGVQHLIDMFREINKKKQILLANGHGNSYFVAQHAVGMLLTLMNKIIPHHLWMKDGKWRTGDKEAASIPLRFKTVGLLGYGAINQKVHKFLSGFDIEFSVFRKNWSKKSSDLPTEVRKYEYPNLDNFLKVIDILIIAVPVTKLTKQMITLKEMKLLGKNGIVVNVARGDIVDEKSLFTALNKNIIQGAAIDVWYRRNPKLDEDGKRYPYNFPFHKLNNIILSPHRGYSPFSDLIRWNEVIENINRFNEGRSDFINIVSLKEGY